MFKDSHQNFTNIKVSTYNFLRQIGEGAFARVWEAFDEREGSTVAVKVIPESKLKDLLIRRLAHSEIKIMKALSDNRNIVRFIDNLRCSKSVLIVMEHCKGGSLDDLLKKEGRLSEDKATNYLKEIINGFKGLHSKNVIHRDLKAANILLNNGVPKIADLGLAKMLTHQEGITHTFAGTSYTMAPEVHKGNYGLKADIWSLGVVYYQMIFGRYPYMGTSDFQILKAAQHSPSFVGVNISPKARDFILKCLTYKQEDRISWQELYKHPLICEQERSVYVVGRKLSLNKDIAFYDQLGKGVGYSEQSSGFLQGLKVAEQLKLQKKQIQQADIRNKAKKEMQARLERYKDQYLDRRNNIMFVFKHIAPHIPYILNMPVNHSNYIYLLCKKAYHEHLDFETAVTSKKNFLQLNPYFQEFTKQPTYRDIVDMVQSQRSILEFQASQFREHVKNADQSLKEELQLETIRKYDWQKYLRQQMEEYEHLLIGHLDHFKREQQKRCLILVIEALSYLIKDKKGKSLQMFDKQIENLNFKDAEKGIRAQQELFLKQFQK